MRAIKGLTVVGTYFLLLVAISITTLPVLAQQSEYALDIDSDNCITDPNDEESNVLYGGALPSSLVVEDTILLSQPPLTPDTDPLEIAAIPANARVIVFDVDEQTRSYFRVVFPCEGYNLAGWVAAPAVRHRVNRTNPKYAPPGCAQPLQVVELLDDVWSSTVNGEIAVVVDLFRSEGGTDYPRSYYYLTKNGREIRDKERVFESSGAFLIRSVVLGTEVRAGNAIGFSVITSSTEELDFFGILYSVPEGCEFRD
ncbi:MAG: hypothetical protein CL610_06505 [Anaerolineaceae bacterium]|nr:hypothetical protein [Anaerolineaceae bacterium]